MGITPSEASGMITCLGVIAVVSLLLSCLPPHLEKGLLSYHRFQNSFSPLVNSTGRSRWSSHKNSPPHWRAVWRSRWIRTHVPVTGKLISSQSRYDHFDTAPYEECFHSFENYHNIIHANIWFVNGNLFWDAINYIP